MNNNFNDEFEKHFNEHVRENLNENFNENFENFEKHVNENFCYFEHVNENSNEIFIENLENEMFSNDDIWKLNVNHTTKSKFEWNSKLSFMNKKKIVFQHLQKNFEQIYASLKHAKTNFVFQKVLI